MGRATAKTEALVLIFTLIFMFPEVNLSKDRS